jgi:hypothetical protein
VNKFLNSLVFAPALAGAIALATLPAAASQLPYYSAGAINSNGSIAVGSGFTVQHTGIGQYVITYPNSTGFTSLPIMTVTPVGVNGHVVTGIISSFGGSNGGAQFTVQLSDKTNKLKLEDNAFCFTLIES